ncbi:MAG TPA: DinB family protein [Terriglobales bacterium]|nr:DinB family protein [Terriglobales bacterium]
MAINPYAPQLGDQNPRQVIGATPSRLQQLFDSLGPARANEPIAPGKWSPRQIFCHLADCEIAFAFRLRQTLAEDHHVMQPFDQDGWAKSYHAYDAASALAVFSALRRWNLALLAAAPKEAASKPVTHPERGTMTFHTIVETMAGHDLNHLKQVEAVAAKAQGAK